MKFTVNNTQLADIVSKLIRFVPKKPLIPSLSSMLLKLEKDRLTVTASNSDITAAITLEVESPTGEGEILMQADNLFNLLARIPDEFVLFDVNEEKKQVKIKWANGSSVHPFFPAEDFVKVEHSDKEDIAFTITAKKLKKAFAKTLFAVSNDESKPVINGVFFDLQKDSPKLVGTNANMLVCYDTAIEGIENKSSIIVPGSSVNNLDTILPNSEDEVNVTTGGSNARFTFGDTVVDMVLTMGKFPNYRSVIPNYTENILGVERELAIGVIKRALVFADKNRRLIKLSPKENNLTVVATDNLFGLQFHESIPCSYQGKEMNIWLKAESLRKILSNIETDTVEMIFRDNLHAVLIRPAEDKEINDPYVAVIMPFTV